MLDTSIGSCSKKLVLTEGLPKLSHPTIVLSQTLAYFCLTSACDNFSIIPKSNFQLALGFCFITSIVLLKLLEVQVVRCQPVWWPGEKPLRSASEHTVMSSSDWEESSLYFHFAPA